MPYVKPEIDETKLLVVTVGLPRSGKSTWARSKRWPIVNRDAIRLALHGERFLKPTEDLVKVAAIYMVKALFLAGHELVVVDETCTTKSRRNFWREGRPWTTVFHHVDTSAEVCKERAIDDPEIQPIIDKMANQFEPLDADEYPYAEPPCEQYEVHADLASGPSVSVKQFVERRGDKLIPVDPAKGDPHGNKEERRG